MRRTYKDNRNGKIELLRFMASLFIMDGHLNSIGYSTPRPFGGAWYYVEMFLIISGWFTAKHFINGKNSTEGGYCYNSIRYTLRKFARFLPYTIPALSTTYLIGFYRETGSLDLMSMAFLKYAENLPIDLLYLSAASYDGSRLFTMWFLSALFLVMPLVCIILQIKNKYIIILVAFYSSVFYYLHVYDFGSHIYPNQIIRVFCGLMLGVLTFFISMTINASIVEIRLSKFRTAICGMAEALFILLPILIGYKGAQVLRINVLCFIVSIAIILSDKSVLPVPSGRLVDLLGAISVPMFIWHLVIALIINTYCIGLSIATKTVLLYLLTLVISILNYIVAGAIRQCSVTDTDTGAGT